jgi:serine/alanine adding enzyme
MPPDCDRSDTPIVRAMTDAAGEWRQAVHQASQATLAHAPEWFVAIRNAYGHVPMYFAAEDEVGRRGLLPAFVVRRPLFGTVVASMPFLDSGGPCSASAPLDAYLIEHLLWEARRLRARAVHLRCTQRLPIAVEPMEHKVLLTLALPEDPGQVWRQLDPGARNKVRKAERCGLSIAFGGVEHLPEFYQVFSARMRDLGSPVHSVAFLRAVLEGFGVRARIGLVRIGRTPIGGLVTVAFKDTLVVPWAACLKDYFPLGPNMLLYWETIRAACTDGFRRFDFGRSSRHSGTYRFKRQWGAHEEPLFWYTIPIRPAARPSASASTSAEGTLIALWQRLPLPLTRTIGPRIRKYLIQ